MVCEERESVPSIHYINLPMNNTIANDLLDIIISIIEEVGDRDLAYEIAHEALNHLNDNAPTIKELKIIDENETDIDSSSIYTSTRLAYLNGTNEGDIKYILEKGYASISTACAVWYDQQVISAITLIKQYVLTH